ncbi:hypothetical protein KEJ50_00500 [Candidatus Bathyarchaeota archaeon]|nr:hypothetical protein [Candidatus Bathyarchaeota archaeon]
MNEKKLKEQVEELAKFILFWSGVVIFVFGLKMIFDSLWPIFEGWYGINFPKEAGVYPGVTLEWGSIVAAYTPSAIVGCAVSIIGIFIMMNGKTGLKGESEPLAKFILFWIGVIALTIGLSDFLYGLLNVIIGRWHEINFPTEVWVPPEIPRGLWFPHLRYNMPYIFVGFIILMMGVFMMKNGQRKFGKA